MSYKNTPQQRVGFVDGTKVVGNTAMNIGAVGAGLITGTANILAVTILGADDDTFIGKMRDGKFKETYTAYQHKTEDFYVNLLSPTADIKADDTTTVVEDVFEVKKETTPTKQVRSPLLFEGIIESIIKTQHIISAIAISICIWLMRNPKGEEGATERSEVLTISYRSKRNRKENPMEVAYIWLGIIFAVIAFVYYRDMK